MKACWSCGASVSPTHRFCLRCGADTTKPPDAAEAQDELVGQTLVGKFRVERQIGYGAMGTIYKADQIALQKAVVIKVLHRHLLGDPELIQRFHREARAASRLNHPNCVQIIDFGSLEDGSLYIAMEYIAGTDLATILEREYPLDHRRLIAITKQICVALDEAAANGVLHRDLKPENIMIEDRRTHRDHVKVVDFGIAKLEDNNPNSKRSFQTRTGIVCGTPEYMSPEQARGQKLDPRSDLYALGVMLYHLVTDRLPFDAPSPIEVVTKHISEAPVPPSTYSKDLPPAFEQLILTLLEKDREKRPASAMDVSAELDRIDRELAQRVDEVTAKPADDQTVVDMRPISQLIELIEMGLKPGAVLSASAAPHAPAPAPTTAVDPQSDTTDQATTRERLRKDSVRDAQTEVQPRPTPSNPTTGPRDGEPRPRPGQSALVRVKAASRDQGSVVATAAPRVEAEAREGRRAADAPLLRQAITVNEKAVPLRPSRKKTVFILVIAGVALAGGLAALFALGVF